MEELLKDKKRRLEKLLKDDWFEPKEILIGKLLLSIRGLAFSNEKLDIALMRRIFQEAPHLKEIGLNLNNFYRELAEYQRGLVYEMAGSMGISKEDVDEISSYVSEV